MPAGAKPRQRDGRATYAGRLVFCLALAVAGKEKCSYSRRAGTSTIGRTSELNCAGRDNSLVPRLDELQINRSTDEIITAFLLNNNRIDSVWEDNFAQLPHLREIYLDRNVLSRIEHGTFAALPELRLLGLSHNRLAPSPGSMMFANLRSLVQLDLVHNRITRLDRQLFQGLTALARLWLSHNRIDLIGCLALTQLTSLAELRMGGNPSRCGLAASNASGTDIIDIDPSTETDAARLSCSCTDAWPTGVGAYGHCNTDPNCNPRSVLNSAAPTAAARADASTDATGEETESEENMLLEVIGLGCIVIGTTVIGAAGCYKLKKVKLPSRRKNYSLKMKWDDSADGLGLVVLPTVQQRGITSPSPRKSASQNKDADADPYVRALAMSPRPFSSSDAMGQTDKLSPMMVVAAPLSKEQRWNNLVDSLILDASPQLARKGPYAGSQSHRAGHTSHRSSRRGLQGGGSVHGGRTASTRRKQRQFRLDLSEALNPELVFEASANHRSTYPSGPALDPVQPQMEMPRAQPGSTHGENNAGGHGTSRYHDNQSTIPTKTREHRPEVKTETPLTSPRPHQPACPSPTGTQSSTTHSVTQSTEEAKAEIASFDAIEEFEALERQTEGELNEDELWRQAMKEGDTEEEEDKQDIAHRTTMPQSRLLYLDSQESQHADTESTDFSSEDEEESDDGSTHPQQRIMCLASGIP